MDEGRKKMKTLSSFQPQRRELCLQKRDEESLGEMDSEPMPAHRRGNDMEHQLLKTLTKTWQQDSNSDLLTESTVVLN